MDLTIILSFITGIHHKHSPLFQRTISFCISLLWIPSAIFAQEQITRGVFVRELNLKKPITSLTLDHDGFIWAGTTSGLYRFDGFEIEALADDSSGIYPKASAIINYLFEDKARHLWVATSSQVYVLNRERNQNLDITALLPFQHPLQNILNIRQFEDEIWLFNTSDHIYCFHLTGDNAITYSRTIDVPSYQASSAIRMPNGNYLVELNIRSQYLILSPAGKILRKELPPAENTTFFSDTTSHLLYALASPNLFTVNPEPLSFKKMISFQSSFLLPVPSWITSSGRNQGGLWFGTKLGHLIWYSAANNNYLNLTQLIHDRLFEGRFFSTDTGIEDKNGGLWFGTSLGLVYIKLTETQYFSHLMEPQTVVSRQSFSTRGMVRTRNDDLMVSSYAGLFLYKKNQPVKEYLIWNNVLKNNVDPVVYAFLPEKDDILMASEGNGLLRYDYETDSIYRLYPSSYFYHTDDSEVKALQWTFKIFKDHADEIWLGLNAGLFTLEKNDQVHRPSQVKGAGREIGRVLDIVEDSFHTLWLGTATGLYSLGADRKELKKHNLQFTTDPGIQCIITDVNDWLWIGTKGHGVIHYRPNQNNIASFTTEQGLADDHVCALQKVDDGGIWISTNQGLSRFDPYRKQFTNFYIEDGLPDNEFNHGSSMKDVDGNLFFGGVNGVVIFHPKQENFNRIQSRLRISKIVLHDGKRRTTVEHLYNSYAQPKIHLGYRDKYFTVYFSSSDPTPISRENYAYRLSGLDNAWQMNGSKNSIQFTGLQPGRYVLQIKALHQTEDQVDMLEIPVAIDTPFFREWWAYGIYILVVCSLAFFIVREYFKRLHIRQQLQLEMDHKARLQEINRSKSAFFTNITHEFKTPLTLIQAPAEEIAHLSKDPQITKKANLITKSAKSILALVNQLLELGKLEANLEEPQYHRLDLVQHIQHWMEKFIPLARQKEIKLGFETEQTAIYADFDPVKLETVINNLLSNAIKFTPEKGKVRCIIKSIEPASLQIIVEDNGPGIPNEEQDLIFDRFYQGKNSILGGTGIGLAFVRETVRVHGGNVIVQSSPGLGATFIVTLPLYQKISTGTNAIPVKENKLEMPVLSNAAKDEYDKPEGFEKPIILLAEDHEEVAQLILDVLCIGE